MIKSFKKSLSIFLAVLMLVSVFSVAGAYAADTDKEKSGEGSVVLDTTAVEGYANWFAWTWTGDAEGHWVDGHGTSAADIKFENVEDQIIFVRMDPDKCGNGETPNWDAKTNQTPNLDVELDSTYVIDGWTGAGPYGSDLPGHWEGGSGEPDIGEYTAKLDPGIAAEEGVVWCAWTWNEDNKRGAHWVEGTEENGKFKFEQLCSMAVFASFYDFNESWDDKISQTEDTLVEDGYKYIITDSYEDEESTTRFTGEWVPDEPDETTEPETEPETVPQTEPETEPVTEAPTTAPDTGIVIPTDSPNPDEDQFLYVTAKSNVNGASSKIRFNGDRVSVIYNLTVPEKLDDGQFTVVYDSSRLELLTEYNTQASMFPVVKDAQYNLGAGPSAIKFNFSGTNGAYDFTKGGVLVNLVFARKSAGTVGTAYVYLNAEDLNSKDTTYIENSKVKAAADIIRPAVSESSAEKPTEEEVKPASSPELIINASSNISSNVQKIKCTKQNVKVTYKMTVPELIAYGRGVVTFDSSKLALESKYNTQDSMFTTLNNQVIYNLHAGSGTMMFNFTSVDPDTQTGTFDFKNGGEVISLMFTVKDGAEGEADVYLDIMDLGSFGKESAEDKDYVVDGKPTADAAAITSNVVLEPQIATVPVEDTTGDTASTDSQPDASSSTDSTESTEPTAPTTATEPSTAPVKPSTNVGKGTSVAAADKFVTALKNDKDPKGSVFNGLKAKAVNPKKNSVKVTWDKVKNAKGYIVYGNKCGNKYKKLKTATGTSFTQKKLKKGTYYKYLIMAFDKNNKILSASKTIHVATKGGKVGNYKKVKLNKTKKTLKKGKTFKLKATCVKESKKLNVKNHRKVKYESTNTKVATVSAKGKIKAKKKGTCKIYAYAQNGVSKAITIKVK